jgi:DNA-nicking Smr family endonuclease
MSALVRKQIYIHKRHEILLKQMAKARGVSEAEIIRQAIERESKAMADSETRQKAWQAFEKFVEARKSMPAEGEPLKWNRDELYEERLKRWDRKG